MKRLALTSYRPRLRFKPYRPGLSPRRSLPLVGVLTVACLLGASIQAQRNDTKDQDGPIPIAMVQRREPIDFEKDLLPVLQSKCLACHNRRLALGDVVLESTETMLSSGRREAVIVRGNSEVSPLLQVAAHLRQPFMPPAGNEVTALALTPEELGLLKLWIDQGAHGSKRRISSRLKWQAISATVKPIYSSAITPDGQYGACGRANQIFLYHLASGRLVTRLIDPTLSRMGIYPESGVSHRDLVHSLAFSPDGRLLVSGGYRTIKFWQQRDVEQVELAASLGQEVVPNWTLKRAIGSVDDSSILIGRITALAFSPDGQLLATGSGDPSRSGELKIWHVESGESWGVIADAHSDTILGMEFSPDGRYLATGSTDRFAKVFHVKTRLLAHNFEGHTHHVLDVAWRADGKVLVSCGADNVIKFWDVETGEQKKTISGYEKEVTSLSFIGKSNRLLISSGDPVVRFGERRLSGVSGFVHTSAVSADGQTIMAGDEDGRLLVWKASNLVPLHILSPPLSPSEDHVLK